MTVFSVFIYNSKDQHYGIFINHIVYCKWKVYSNSCCWFGWFSILSICPLCYLSKSQSLTPASISASDGAHWTGLVSAGPSRTRSSWASPAECLRAAGHLAEAGELCSCQCRSERQWGWGLLWSSVGLSCRYGRIKLLWTDTKWHAFANLCASYPQPASGGKPLKSSHCQN